MVRNHLNQNITSQIVSDFDAISTVNKLSIIFILLLPIFHLTFNGWTGVLVVLSFLFSLLSLVQNKESIHVVFRDNKSKWVIFGLIAYSLAIFLSQLCRWSFSHRAYLDSSPFLYFIPIFIFIAWKKINMGRWFQLILPIMIIGAYWSTFYNHRELANPGWVNDRRLAPYFSDPLAFGQIILTLGLMCIASIQLTRKKWLNIILCVWSIFGFVLGIYLSIQSGSRTGWLAIPIVVFFILITKLNWKLSISLPVGLIISVVICLTAYHLSAFMHERVDLAMNEIFSYPWSGGIAPDTSVGLRITFQRLGWFYYSNSPIYGWGTAGYTVIKDAPEVASFSSQYARDFVYSALFHNEIMTQIVRYGLFGIIAYVFAVLVPFIIFFKYLSTKNPTVKQAALLGICFLTCQIVSGFTDEFLNLKGMVAFYAFVISSLLGTIIAFADSPQDVDSIFI
jgi:O-antigen ligase